MQTTTMPASHETSKQAPGVVFFVPLIFSSGACALVYQTVWLREFRLIFGSSTAASAAVLAIFIGGLGAGGLWLGKRADHSANPLRLYAALEAVIAVLAACTPGLLYLIRQAYILTGGTNTLGAPLGTLLRLVLAALVLLPPTLLMGGTLPAATRAFAVESDAARRRVSFLYGVNTLGSVFGCLAATFFFLETLGARGTLWLACIVNLGVALAAWQLAKAVAPLATPSDPSPESPDTDPRPAALILAASAISGMVFFLMEIVWYRMLGPLLGGTIYTFGLILSVVLLGIGLGGLFFAAIRSDKPASISVFALISLIEAVCIAFPFALGDRLALWSAFLWPWSQYGFYALAAGWFGIAFIAIFPAAFVSGIQFPMLIALLGRGRTQLGRQIGLVYALNTAGATIGALAGGLVLLPLLSAPNCWKLAALLFALLGMGILSAARGRYFFLAGCALTVLTAAMVVLPEGPTAVWRHSGIGVGLSPAEELKSPNNLLSWKREREHVIAWQTDGFESSVALEQTTGYAFILNGKVDGHCRKDAAMQVMGGLVGALLHPEPKHSLVIGLGTGSTAGWLGKVETMERVDVVELEPSIVRVAEACSPVNENVLQNPLVNIAFGDAREYLLTSPYSYDIVFSEPSNPYRAGIAGLFTREYYQAVSQHLNKSGLFLQWVQTYDIDAPTLKTIAATLQSVFDHVEIWNMGFKDILFVASQEPFQYAPDQLSDRISAEPYRSALLHAWQVVNVEGFLAHYLTDATTIATYADASNEPINTDNHNRVEFGFARALVSKAYVNESSLFSTAWRLRQDPTAFSKPDWSLVDRERAEAPFAVRADVAFPVPVPDKQQEIRNNALAHFARGEFQQGLSTWQRQTEAPKTLTEHLYLAEAYADAGDPEAETLSQFFQTRLPVETSVVMARLRLKQGRLDEAASLLTHAFQEYRNDPWPAPLIMQRSLALVRSLTQKHPRYARHFFAVLEQPFAAKLLNYDRELMRIYLGSMVSARACTEGYSIFEPNAPWSRHWLAARRQCYQDSHNRLAEIAAAELREFERLR